MIRKVLFVVLVLPAIAYGQDHYFDSDGVSIRYRVQGVGTPVVLVHGFTGSLDLWMHSGIFEALSETYRVVAFDSRGHGLSEKPHDPSAYGDQMARDILNLMNHLDMQRAHLVGYSMGSRLVGQFLVTWPDRLITATLGASPPRRNWDAAQEEQATRFAANVRERAATAEPNDGQDYEALAAIPASWGSQAVSDEQLASSRIPVLAIVGSKDPRVDGLQAVGDILPDMELVIVDGATHAGESGLPLRPEFLRSIQDFLGKYPGGQVLR